MYHVGDGCEDQIAIENRKWTCTLRWAWPVRLWPSTIVVYFDQRLKTLVEILIFNSKKLKKEKKARNLQQIKKKIKSGN